MLVDTLVVSVGIAAFQDITLALYAVITIFVTGKVIDAVVTGLKFYMSAVIISDHADAIRDRIINEMRRGGTFLLGQGMYREQDKKVIFCAVSRRELAALREHIREIDAHAFMTVWNTREILGEGFKDFSQLDELDG